MKTKFLIFISFCSAILILSSCATNYMIMSADESFEALTKITDEKKVSFNSVGGDMNKNMFFCAKEDDGSSNIYLKDNVMSSIITQKTFGSNFCASPDYCVTNNRVVYSAYSNGQNDIYYIDNERGRVQTQITSTAENEYNPCWSPNGKYIIFEKGTVPRFIYFKNNKGSSAYKRLTENQIWLKNIETGELQLIGNGSFPRFSHDNNQIVFVKYQLNRTRTQEIGTIWIMDINGENQKQITGTNLGYASCPSWSPNDNYIVFQLRKTDKSGRLQLTSKNDIFTINVNGEEVMQHTSNKSNDCIPYWSSDNFIYFTSDRGGKEKMYKIWRFKVKL